MKEKFNELAKQENGTFNFTEETISLGMGVKDYQAVYSLDFEFEGEIIQLKNYRGLKSVGTIETSLSCENEEKNFTIETKSPLSWLFSLRNKTYKISTENESLRKDILLNPTFKKLIEIVEKTRFEPYIEARFYNGNLIVKTEYHLLLPEREEILEPLINFHKFVIKTLKQMDVESNSQAIN